jgi:hypothetical protein
VVPSDLSGAFPVKGGAGLLPQPSCSGIILDLVAIEASLREVQENFAGVNSGLGSPREPLDRFAVDNMMAGYAFTEELVVGKVDLFAIGQLRLFLEMNALVLCGRDEQVRLDSAQHLAATDKYFFDNVDGGVRDVVEWHALHANGSAWMRAAGVYIRILSEPELFIEGNHRTGALIISYILARAGHPPFVLTVPDAKEFFDWSTLFGSKRKSGFFLRWQMPWLTHRFAKFLIAHADPRFLCARRG